MKDIKNYLETIERETQSRRVLRTAAQDIVEGVAKEGKYSIQAVTAEERARRVLDDPNNGLSPSEECELRDNVRNAYHLAAYGAAITQ